MSKALNTKFTIVGNEISSNILGIFLKYHSNINKLKLNIDLYHLEKEKLNLKNKTLNTKRLSFQEIYDFSYKKEKKNSNLNLNLNPNTNTDTNTNTNFDIKIYKKLLLEEFRLKLNNNKDNKNSDKILLGEIDNFYRLNNNKQINQYIFDKMNIFENKKIIQYGNKTNLQRFNIKNNNNNNDNDNEIFIKEKNINFSLAIRLKLFDFKIKRRKDISLKLLEKDLNLEEYLNQLNISKEVNEYLKGFYKCKEILI